jgi:hypothetical protein
MSYPGKPIPAPMHKPYRHAGKENDVQKEMDKDTSKLGYAVGFDPVAFGLRWQQQRG